MSIFRHSHDYEAVAVQHRSVGGNLLIPGTMFTTILWRCKCKNVCSQELAGKWTLEQVLGQRETAVAKEPVGAADPSLRGNSRTPLRG